MYSAEQSKNIQLLTDLINNNYLKSHLLQIEQTNYYRTTKKNLCKFANQIQEFDINYEKLELLNYTIEHKQHRLSLLLQIEWIQEKIDNLEKEVINKYQQLSNKKKDLEEYRNYLNFFLPSSQKMRIEKIDGLLSFIKNEKINKIEKEKNYEISEMLKDFDDKARKEYLLRG